MTRKTLMAATLAMTTLAGLAAAPPAQSQGSLTPRMMCVVFEQVTWRSARVVIEQLNQSGSWSELFSVVTVPHRRCIYTNRNITRNSGPRVRFTIEAHENGTFRMICRATSIVSTDATLRVVGMPMGAHCHVFE
ncbi:MAG: hypothetical protein NTW56_17310 [Alphaproteobacteria bacterium]|nr:hypothetical protein [Alphaproteobacteria bacterium]